MEYKGYTVVQASNNHVWLGKDGKMLMHAQCTRKFTDDELKQEVDSYIRFNQNDNLKSLLDELEKESK